MDPTTLVTFLYSAAPNVRTVELLGSWDNFAQPYQMHHDRRRGKGFWSGCFKFENIVFDGDHSYFHTKPRAGGLKQGGVYWYYYRLDHGVEAYDDSRECTVNCPLLPGQKVNVMEVPTEVLEPPSRCRSAGFWGVEGTLSSWPGPTRQQTLEPSDKFATLEPPPVSRVHGRCISDLALSGRLEGRAPSPVQPLETPLTTSHDADDESPALERRPSKRPCTADRRSTHSRSSSHSVASSYAHSDIVDAYAVHSPYAEEHPDPLRSCPMLDDSSAQPEHTNHCGGFDLGINADNSGVREALSAVEEADESVYGPASVRDVQFYGSSPETTDEGPQWRPRMYSVRNKELHVTVLNNADATCADAQPPRYSTDDSSQGASTDLWSPTFSAATVSSNGGGLNTPFRLSGGYSRDASADEHALDDTTAGKHLQSLDTDHLSPPSERRVERRTSFAGHYSLPRTSSQESGLGNSLRELKDAVNALDLPIPAAFARQRQGSAGAEDAVGDIFSELGYLGGSII